MWVNFILIPSKPAIKIAAYAKYGLHVASGLRISKRRNSGVFAYAGIRITALRFEVAYPTVTGASNPGTNLLNEFVLGFVIAQSYEICFNSPPMK